MDAVQLDMFADDPQNRPWLLSAIGEADKVIAELEESHKKEVEQLLMEIAELKAQKAQTKEYK